MAPRALPVLTVVAALAGAAAGAGAAAAQEPTPADTAAAIPPRAAYDPPRVAVSVTAGVLRFGEIQAQRVLAEVVEPDGTVSGTADLRRTLEGGSDLTAGLSALLGLTPAWAIRAGAWWGRGSLRARYAGEDAFADDAEALTRGREPRLRVLAAEAALRFRLASSRRVQPYAEIGVAAVEWESDEPDLPGAADLAEPVRRWAPLAALGAVVPLRERLSARVQASGHFQRTPLRPGPAGAELYSRRPAVDFQRIPLRSAALGALLAGADTLRLTFADPQQAAFADAALEMTRTIRLEAGLSLELGRARAPAARRSGSRAP